jgi:hypothetical protein
MAKVVGYMEGTDPLWLTSLSAMSYTTMPLSNGWDGFGMNIQLITDQRKPDLVLCYLHKLIPTPGADVTPGDLLERTKMFDIPVLIVCPRELHALAQTKAGDLPGNAELTDPADVMPRIKVLNP